MDYRDRDRAQSMANDTLGVKRVNGKSPFSSKSEIVKQAARQTRSLFFRDLFEPLEKNGWFN